MALLLGGIYPAFQALVRQGGQTVAEWRRYSAKTPWVLKVSERQRSLFYARPDGGALQVTVLLGNRAVEAALAGGVSKRLHPAIRAAKAYPEGRPVTLWIKRPEDLAKVEQLIAVKRQAAARAVARRPGRASRVT
jgi:hypothetical protein